MSKGDIVQHRLAGWIATVIEVRGDRVLVEESGVHLECGRQYLEVLEEA